MKLVPKMTGLLAVSAAAVLVGYGYLTLNREQDMLRESVVTDASLVARVMRRSFLKEYKAEGKEAAFKLLDYAGTSEDRIQLSVISLPEQRSGETLRPVELDHAQIDSLEEGREVLIHRDDPPSLALFLPISLPDEPALALLLEKSIQREEDYLGETRLHIGVATLVLALLMGGIAFLVGSRVVGVPIRLLIEKAQRVGQGNLTGPVRLRQSDEIGELAKTMNRMCDDLAQETQRRVQALHQLRHAERLATVGQLASGIAHELGTPLNVVLGRAMLNASGNGSLAGVAENSRVIVEQTERMSGIIRQLLDFARRGTVETAPADLREVVQHLARLLEPLAKEAQVNLSVEPSTDEARAFVDTNQIEQALTNLVVNAIHATPEGGGVRLRVDVAQACPPGDGHVESPHVRVAIEDDGAGIPAAAGPRLFEPFFTTKEVGQGTGLGLPVAHGIVSDHGGWIQVESEASRGSRFSVYLPVAEGASA